MSVRGLKEAITNLRQYQRRMTDEARRANRATGEQVRTAAVRKIQASGSGRVYEIAGPPRRTHRASAPGEPPATDTGALARNIYVESADGGLTVFVGTNQAHGRYLEHGTAMVAPRPWLMPSMEGSRADHMRRMQEIHNRAVG